MITLTRILTTRLYKINPRVNRRDIRRFGREDIVKKITSIVVLCLFFITGCGATQYQLEVEKAYYQAISSSKSNAQPLVEFVPADTGKPMVFDNLGKLTVYAPPVDKGQVHQYVQKDYAAPWIQLFGQVASVAAPWIGAASIVKSVANIAGSTSVSGEGNTLNYGNIDNTSTPTVVTQPAPTIVNPVIVEAI